MRAYTTCSDLAKYPAADA